jgi:hypothetical protein
MPPSFKKPAYSSSTIHASANRRFEFTGRGDSLYAAGGNVIDTHEHPRDFKNW